ncbi:MAG: alkaline phosphatase family protein [Cytophagales bacterium]|nr:MAG: alkaline phosphatase family protein [Cytophagales bacterium]
MWLRNIVYSLIFISFFNPILKAQNKKTTQTSTEEMPRLIVGIVIDQMRFEYLQRFSSRFSKEGFVRLMQEGFECRNTHYNYISTETACGHASIHTGTVPAYHGIIANLWFEKGNNRYCVSDSTEKTVGAETLNGNMSPRTLLATTFADQMRLASNHKALTYAVSIKDRGAILPIGHTGNAAYWFDRTAGKFISSTYYMNNLPAYIQKYNEQKPADTYLQQTWNTYYPIETYTNSVADNNNYENLSYFYGKETPTFPYDLAAITQAALKANKKPYDMLTATPFGNQLVKEMAFLLLENEPLGKDTITDFLSVSFSSPDIAGHSFGPHSVEIEDIYIRLDLEIAALLKKLDEKVGKGKYLIYLTADHAASEVPAYLKDVKVPSGYWAEKEINEKLNQHLVQAYGEGKWVLQGNDQQIYLNRELALQKKIDIVQVRKTTADFLRVLPQVFDVFTIDELRTPSDEYLRSFLQNGIYHKRSGDVCIIVNHGILSDYWKKGGTSHGTHYRYDTHIPLLWYGWKISKGYSVEPVKIIDIAPTITTLLRVQFPSSSVGNPIEDVFESLDEE